MKFFDRNLGLTNAGLEVPSMEEMIQQNYKYLEEATGKPIDRASDGPIGQLFEISSKFWLDTWKQLQVFVGLFAYPRGIFADWFAGYTGFKRLPAIKASAILDVYGRIGADSDLSKLAEFNDSNGKSWTRKISSNIGVEAHAQQGSIKFPQKGITSFIIDWAAFDSDREGGFVVLNHRTNIPYHTIRSNVGNSLSCLQNSFDSALNKFSIVKNFQNNENLWLCRMPFGEMCSIAETNMGVWKSMIATPFQIYVENDDYTNGEILPAHEINSIAGSFADELVACTNPVAIFRARDVESDLDLFKRMQYSRRMYGGCSAVALEQRLLQDVTNVSFCRIMENASSAPIEIRSGVFMPPKSIMPLIEGGDKTEIENFLLKYVPTTASVFGVDFQRMREVIDPVTGEPIMEQAIGWNSPKPRHVDLKITILDFHKDNPFPVGGENKIKEEILNWAYGRYSIGEDLILKDFFTPINKVIGTARVLIEQKNAEDCDGWQAALQNSPATDNDIHLWDEYIHINDIQVG